MTLKTSPWLGNMGRALDVALAVWCIGWLWMAWAVSDDVRGLTHLARTVQSVGNATVETGQAVESLGSLPLVGGDVREAGEAIQRAGADAVRSATASRKSVGRTSALLGFSIALIPTLPLLLLYVPQRLYAVREQREIARAVRGGGDAALERLLAFRAVVHLPVRDLRTIAADPIADIQEGRHRALAAAELQRLGIDREQS